MTAADSRTSATAMTKLVDRYTLGARVFPVIVATAPLFFAISAWIPFSQWPIKLFAASGGLVVAAFALSHLARDAGKALEAPLWASWGGPPTARMLRHRDGTFLSGIKAKIHNRLVELGVVPRMPSPDEEQADPAGADDLYLTCSDWLRGKALQLKGTSPFDVVHSENISYGYHRNLYGIRKVAIAVAIFATVIIIGAFIYGRHPFIELIAAVALGAYVWFGVTEARLRRAADNYSHRLLSGIEAIPLTSSARSNRSGGRRGNRT